ncbi:MAG: SRPBCC family protein [Capsulimonadales bacterium]|nr:SRPBCC family protein [Capsulimonadales bacterium]
MPANNYQFFSHWTAPGATVEEVFAVLSDVEGLSRWWPAVYLAVTPVPGETTETPTGRRFDLRTKGWLPYTVNWRLTVGESQPPVRSVILASGDFEGRGVWNFEQTADGVNITFDWKLIAEKPLLKMLSPCLSPMFAANHTWAMEQGQISLLRELERRRGKEALPPPRPTTWEPFAVFGAVLAVLFGVGFAIVRRKRR